MRSHLLLYLLAIVSNALAQPTLTIGTNTRVVGSGAQLVYGGGALTNNGSLSLAAGQLSASGPTTYGGSGAATVANVSFSHSTGTSTLNSLLSVTNRATLSANTALNTNGQLYLRTDQFPNADLVNNGILTGTVQGLVTRGTVLTGNTPYSSLLSTNVSGTSASYQWQSSADNTTWADIAGATSPTYTANVSATTYYRCRLTTSNSNFNQTTPAMLLSFTGAPPQPIRYVTQTGTGDGSSWASASGDLQAMIDAAGVEQVWVAGGTFKPSVTGLSNPRTASFTMKNNVAIYGGFVGTETSLTDRPAVNPILGTPSSTTLSGDIGTPGDKSDNCYHVFYHFDNGLTSTAVLDGVVISSGNASGGGNSATTSAGGGMYNRGISPTLTNCVLANNSAANGGGGIHNLGSNTTLTNCLLVNNSTSTSGGGIFISSGNSTLTNCLLVNNNAAQRGGGIYTSGSNTLTNCKLINNSATSGDGGGIYIIGSPTLTNCNLINNSAGGSGGGIYNVGSPALVNCSLQANSAINGGGIFNNNTGSPTLTNCSLLSNSAPNGGGGIYNNGSGSTTLANCVLWDNGAGSTIVNNSPATLTATYCLFDATVTGYTGTNNLTTTTSPFVSANPQTTDAVALAPNSPAINAGSNEAYDKGPQTDLVGNPRIFPTGGTIDMGAIESQTAPVTLSALAVSPNPVCAGSRLRVTATVGNTTGSYAYTLSTGNNPVSGTASGAAFSQTLTASGSGTQSLSLTISANGQLVTASTSLTVTELPTPGLTANFSGVLTCAQTSLTLTATGGVSFTFANAMGTLGTPGPTNTLPVSQAGTYVVQVANASGCISQTSIIVSSNQTAPALSVSPSSATLSMANPTVTLTASGDGSFRWSTGETSPAISVTASGTYSVTLTSPGGCTASASVPVVGVDLTVTLELPQATFAAMGSVGNLVVNVFEVGGVPTSSGTVTITITVPVGYTLSFAADQTSIQVSGGSTVAVDNGQWTVTNSQWGSQLSLTMNSGAFIGSKGKSRLGFSITRTSANSGSTSNITVNVADDQSRTYDGNASNNVYARIISSL